MLIFDFIALLLLACFVGLWWSSEFLRDDYNVKVMKGTFALFIFSLYFYKAVIKQKSYLPKPLFAFYWFCRNNVISLEFVF